MPPLKKLALSTNSNGQQRLSLFFRGGTRLQHTEMNILDIFNTYTIQSILSSNHGHVLDPLATHAPLFQGWQGWQCGSNKL